MGLGGSPIYDKVWMCVRAEKPPFSAPLGVHRADFLVMRVICKLVYICKQVVNLFTNHRGYKRVYKSKEQFMYVNFLWNQVYEKAGAFSMAGYMIVVGFKTLTRTPVPKLPWVAPPPHTHTHTITEDIKGYISSKNRICIGQLSVKSSIWIGWFF